MTTMILGSLGAPRIREFRPIREPEISQLNLAATNLARLFGLDRPRSRPRLCCHWQCEPDGRLACIREPDIMLAASVG